MQESGRQAHYFLSANTPQGFVSRPDQLYNARDGWQAYILKGGPGCGKSRLIRAVGEAMQAQGRAVEFIHCTSDTSELDGVAVPSLRVCVLDGTPPHPIEPKYPGVVEHIINLGDCCDDNVLAESRDRILLFAARIAGIYDRVYRFLSAAGSLLGDVGRNAMECADLSKIERYAARVARREFPSSPSARRRPGRETQRLLSGVTPDGVIFYSETLDAYERIFILEDDFSMGRFLLVRLKNAALAAGYDVIACACPMSPGDKLEHLLIPSLSLAFVTSNRYHRYERKGCRHIHVRRFLDNDALRERRQRLSFNRRAARELIAEAVKLLAEARQDNKVLREAYAAATDLDAVDKKARELIEKLTR